MPELIVFPDVEDLLRRHLSTHLPELAGTTTVDVGQTPSTFPARHVFVRRTGGVVEDVVVDRAQVTVESRAKTAGQASALAALVRALVGAAERAGQIEGVPIYEVREFSGPYLDPDPVNPKVPRYSATYQLAVRGSAA